MKQQKIANWLKGIVIVLAILGAMYVIGTALSTYFLQALTPDSELYIHLYFNWFIIAVCYIVLILFWKVCTEIGNGNSFSLTNVTAFHQIAMCGIIIAGCFLFELIWVCVIGEFPLMMIIWTIFKMIICGIFIVLCEALSKLILHAYEIRQENELTI